MPMPHPLIYVRVLTLFWSVVFTILNAYFLYYVDELARNHCKCAEGWQRRFMEATLVLFVIMGAIGLFFNWQRAMPWFGVAMGLLALVYIFVARSFLDDVSKDACMCAETRAYNLLNFYNWVQILILAVATVNAVIVLIVTAFGGSGGGGGGGSGGETDADADAVVATGHSRASFSPRRIGSGRRR